LDASLFYNEYDKYRSLNIGRTYLKRFPTALSFVLPLFMGNTLEGETWGIELAATWDVLSWWRLRSSYSYLDIDMHDDRDTWNAFSNPPEKSNPHGQFFLWSSLDLPWNLEWDLGFRYVDNLGRFVDSYCEMDTRLGWRPVKKLEISLVGRNLLDPHHPEFIASRPGGEGEVERSIYGKVTWRF